MTRVIITGATGFIGRHALSALRSRGFEVVGIGRRDPGGIEFHEADLLDATALTRALRHAAATHLLHLAWISEPRVYWTSPENLAWASATLGLLRGFCDLGGRRAVVAGSCAEYEWGAPRFVEASTPCRPVTLYGAAKDATRRLCEAYAIQSELSLAWGRIFYLYGPGESGGRLVSDAIEACRTGRDFETTHGRQKRDFLHVRDVAEALVALIASNVEGAVNVASGNAVPVRNVLDIISKAFDAASCMRYGVRELSATEPDIVEGDVTRLTEQVGFRPHFDLLSGLRHAIAARLDEV